MEWITLAVTLAFSAVEDIIAKYSEDGDDEAMLESPIAKLASSRLDTELQRLHAQDKEIMYDDDYSKMPDAVKRFHTQLVSGRPLMQPVKMLVHKRW